ncbi:hypothetical protein JHK85_053552 [Glycine max]|nr:hypothetical protein JHK85_053552 [Glycine max]
MEKMGVMLITLFLFIAATVAEDADNIGEAIIPENPKFKKFVTDCTSHVAERCSSGSEALHGEGGLALCLFDSMENCLVEHGAAKVNQRSLFVLPKGSTPIEPKDSLPSFIPSPPIPPKSKFECWCDSLISCVCTWTSMVPSTRTVLRTCSLESARTCLNAPNVATSPLAACLIPSMNQCVYPSGAESGTGSLPIKA